MASTENAKLPDGFLDGPAPNLTKHTIDFKEKGIPQYAGKWAVILDGVLSQEECDLLLGAAEVTTNGQWERVRCFDSLRLFQAQLARQWSM